MSLKEIFEIESIESRLNLLYQSSNPEVENLRSEFHELASEIVKKCFQLLKKYENILISTTDETEKSIIENTNANVGTVSPSLTKKQTFIREKNTDSFVSHSSQSEMADNQTKDEQSVEEQENRSSMSERKKSGGFGIKSMLSSLTKSRPKPRRGGETGDVQKNALPDLQTALENDAIVSLDKDIELEQDSTILNVDHAEHSLPSNINDSLEPENHLVIEESESAVQVKKYVPTNAMSALASAMRAGLSDSNIVKSVSETEPPPMPSSPRPSRDHGSSTTPPPVAIKPRPRRSSIVNGSSSSLEQQQRPYTYHEGDKSISSQESHYFSPPTALRRSLTSSNGPSILPRPPPRPFSSALPNSINSEQSPLPGNGNSAVEVASETPVVLSSKSTPISSLSPQSRPLTPKHESPIRTNSNMDEPVPIRTKEEEARYQLALKAQKSSPPKTAIRPQIMSTGPALSFKKKENSTSGDDKALEKKALDWLNSKLSSRGMEPITDLYSIFADGTTIIHALESASGQSVGKYNKKGMLQVHKLDNTTVALSFISKFGAETHEYSPQTLLDGHKGKILSLFNFFPESMTTIFTIRLDDDGSFAEEYFRLPPPNQKDPYSLRLVITSGSLASMDPVLFTNLPLSSTAHFNRSEYKQIPFTLQAGSDHTISLQIFNSGCYEFFVEYSGSDGNRVHSRSNGRFVVDPRLTIFKNGKSALLPLDGITVLTIIPKWMPTVSSWMPFFKQFSNTGYNMVHFAPINKRGISNSPYAIYDQLDLSDDLFDAPMPGKAQKFELLASLIQDIHKQFNILSVTDIVWNHTSCDSQWLQIHPEAGYNLKTAPHLRPAFELDETILAFSDAIEKSNDNVIVQEGDLTRLMEIFQTKHFQPLRLHEFYVLDIQKSISEFSDFWRRSWPPERPALQKFFDLISISDNRQKIIAIKSEILLDPKAFTRFSKRLDFDASFGVLTAICQTHSISNYDSQIHEFEKLLKDINLLLYQEYDEDCRIIMDQLRNRARFLRLEEHGPRLGPISRTNPFVDTYFTRLPRNELTKNLHPDEMALACNGWIWNADPLVNFAGPESKAYLRREVIGWGDCVKLRYGDGPDDNPWLWEHQVNYTVKMAKLFHGFRIDNCHSTPIHVASFLLDKAREVNPNLYVFAELFTGSEKKDIMFVSKLGINSLIREAMNAWDPTEMSRLVHRQGGSPVGSFTIPPHQFPVEMIGHDTGSDYYHALETKGEFVISVKASSPHSLFMDCTHDNETPNQKRRAVDTLSNAALVAMSTCAIGSVKGYDEIIPKLLDVVNETKKYRLPKETEGIMPVKSVLYPLHAEMAALGFNEIHVNQEHDYISVHRMHPITHDGYLAIVRTAFKNLNEAAHSPIRLKSQHVKLVQSSSLNVESEGPQGTWEYRHNPGEERTREDLLPQPRSPCLYHPLSMDEVLQGGVSPGAKGKIRGLRSSLNISNSECNLTFVKLEGDIDKGEFETIISINTERFHPGSVVIFRTFFDGKQAKDGDESSGVLDQLRLAMGLNDNNLGIEIMSQLGADMLDSAVPWGCTSRPRWIPGLKDAVELLSSSDINILLYRTAPEEQDTIGQSVYDVPGFGPLAYCGLQGLVSVLFPVVRNNDLGHPICSNLRQGPWLYDYVLIRLQKYLSYNPGLKPILEWLTSRIELVKKLPPSFSPKYFSIVIICAFEGIRHQALFGNSLSKVPPKKLGKIPSSLDVFAFSCAMTSFQCYGSVKSTGLLPKPYPFPLKTTEQHVPISSIRGMPLPSLAAGLPHFSVEYARCWGRDIFIALRGLFLIPGNFAAARAHLLAFGSTLKHGLIPNLLDQGIRPRYNARDAVWFWINSVFDYCRESPEGLLFLDAPVARRFIPLKQFRNPNFGTDKPDPEEPGADDYILPNDERVYKYTNTVAQLCQEILQRHMEGIDFIEWSAGTSIDHAMRTEGFHIKISIDEQTGFVKGGSRWNCGTWMDKMGDSGASGNIGVPATPRDGSAIELVGLQKAALSFITGILLSRKTSWIWQGVSYYRNGKKEFLDYVSWEKKIQESFEKCFYIPQKSSLDSQYEISRPDLVNRRGIYKDSYGSAIPFADYQLRPNVCIAMVKAPELFDPHHGRIALLTIKKFLLGPLGIKTLDPNDWAYRGVYDNRNESTDPTIAHGFNYHQGPEWIWVMGYFLRAYLYFFTKADGYDPLQKSFHINEIQRILQKHKIFIIDSVNNPFAGLPELTNEDGSYCGPSCPTQAWSTSVMIELISEIRQSTL